MVSFLSVDCVDLFQLANVHRQIGVAYFFGARFDKMMSPEVQETVTSVVTPAVTGAHDEL